MPAQSKVPIAIAAILFSLLASSASMGAANGGAISSDAAIHAVEAWAFPMFPPPPAPHAPKPRPNPHKMRHVTGSTVSYTQAQMDRISDPDWFPQDHPAPPILKDRVDRSLPGQPGIPISSRRGTLA